jgi:hypothetical protein
MSSVDEASGDSALSLTGVNHLCAATVDRTVEVVGVRGHRPLGVLFGDPRHWVAGDPDRASVPEPVCRFGPHRVDRVEPAPRPCTQRADRRAYPLIREAIRGERRLPVAAIAFDEDKQHRTIVALSLNPWISDVVPLRG